MSTTITTRNGRRIEVEGGVIIITDLDDGRYLGAELTEDEQRRLSAALATDRGGHWTRDDLPDAMELTSVYLEAEGGSENAFIEVLDAVVDHLDAHHPRPVPYDEGGITGPRLYMPLPEAWTQPPLDFSGVGWKAMYERGIEKRVEVLNRAARAERERDELREHVRNIGEGMVRAQNQRGEMRRERDEWKARSEAAEARAEADNRYSGTPNHAFVEGAMWATRHVLGQRSVMRELPYVPTTEEVRDEYANGGGEYRDIAEGWFDSWLDRERAVARREGLADGWDEGEADGRHNAIEHRPGMKFTNPYLEEDPDVDQ